MNTKCEETSCMCKSCSKIAKCNECETFCAVMPHKPAPTAACPDYVPEVSDAGKSD